MNPWICPKCEAVMAPFQPTCFYCKPKSVFVGNKIVETFESLPKFKTGESPIAGNEDNILTSNGENILAPKWPEAY